jgi:hypothetical protein
MRDVGPHLGVSSKDVLIVLWGCVKSESKGECGKGVADVHENAAYKNAAFLDLVTDLLQQAYSDAGGVSVSAFGAAVSVLAAGA